MMLISQCPKESPHFVRIIVRIIVGEYEQTAVYKRCNVVGKGPDSVLETASATFNPRNVKKKW